MEKENVQPPNQGILLVFPRHTCVTQSCIAVTTAYPISLVQSNLSIKPLMTLLNRDAQSTHTHYPTIRDTIP
eukprot:5125693-Pyramimonas_sp.AAC.1